MTIKRVSVMFTLAAAVICLALAEESATVSRKTLEVRQAKTQLSPVAFTANQGDRLTITEHGADGWLAVKQATGDKSGFVRELQLMPEKEKVAVNTSATPLRGGRDADASAAVKGIDPDAIKYAAGKNYDTTGLTRMVDMRASIKPEDLDQFRKDGNLK